MDGKAQGMWVQQGQVCSEPYSFWEEGAANRLHLRSNFAFLVCLVSFLVIARDNILGKRNCCKGFDNELMRCGREAFNSHILGVVLSESLHLGSEHIYQLLFLPCKWDIMARVGQSGVFPLQVNYDLIITQKAKL